MRHPPHTLPDAIMSLMPFHTAGMASGSLPTYAPQCSPTSEMFFNSTRFKATLGMLPAANPTTRYRPFHAMQLDQHWGWCQSRMSACDRGQHRKA